MIILILVSTAWALSFGLIKGNLTTVDSNFVSFIRMTSSLIIFVPLLRLKNLNRQLALKLILAGMMQFGVMYIAYIASFRYLHAYEVALFTVFTPIYVTLIDDALQKKFTPFYFSTALLAVFGTWIVKRENVLSQDLLTGFFLVQVSNLCFAFGQVFYRRLMIKHKNIKDPEIFGLLYLGGVMITLAATLIFTPISEISLSAEQIWTLVYLGAFASGICFFLWNIGAQKVNTGTLAVFNDLKIPLAVMVSLLVFGEKTNMQPLLTGGSIVLVSLVLNELFTQKEG